MPLKYMQSTTAAEANRMSVQAEGPNTSNDYLIDLLQSD